MAPRKSPAQKRNLPDRRQRERRVARRRLRLLSVPVERRTGADRRRKNRRKEVRRTADTLSAKKKIYQRSGRKKTSR